MTKMLTITNHQVLLRHHLALKGKGWQVKGQVDKGVQLMESLLPAEDGEKLYIQYRT